VISDSWGTAGGDVIELPSARRTFDNVLLMAAGTGIGVQFSSGDEGDEFIIFGVSVGGYPETNPFITSVGGTSLEVSKRGARAVEPGWSTSKSTLCNEELEELEQSEAEPPQCTNPLFNSWLPPAPGAYLYGSGGMTSYFYEEPSYQQGVVPTVLAERNHSITKTVNRVEPDISMDADPTTGMLFGYAGIPRRRLLRRIPDRRHEPLLAAFRRRNGRRRPGRGRLAGVRQPAAVPARGLGQSRLADLLRRDTRAQAGGRARRLRRRRRRRNRAPALGPHAHLRGPRELLRRNRRRRRRMQRTGRLAEHHPRV
jgi:hypothetical protein